jgi:tetraacyldisaccharide 4'-kinase
VISVGNISVGGTGKSVVVDFLCQLLGPQSTAVIMRGYRGANELKNEGIVVGSQGNVYCDASVSGDEAFMLAKFGTATIAVGANRYSAAKALDNFCSQHHTKLNYVILDDSYQNIQLKKDFEILVVDARRPFENGHCLPAGALREKDFTRADAVVLTHADCVDQNSLNAIKNLFRPCYAEKIFTGKHLAKNLLNKNLKKFSSDAIRQKKILAFAGIGSFDQFEETVKQMGGSKLVSLRFEDHHKYSQHDIDSVLKLASDNGLDTVITTKKDWVKIDTLLPSEIAVDFFIVDVVFEFLSNSEYILFNRFLRGKLGK